MKTLHDRPIAFPDAAAFGDIFRRTSPWIMNQESPVLSEVPSWEAGTWSDKSRRTTFQIRGYMSIDGQGGYRSLRVDELEDGVADWINANMLNISDGSVHFKVVCWDDGKALVCAEFDKIIGSAYLAVIDAATIPSGE